MAASNAQVQQLVRNRLRPMCNRARSLLLEMEAIRAEFDDIYANVNDAESTFEEVNSDNPPHLMSKGDVMSLNTFMADTIGAIRDNAQLPIVLKCCTQGL